MQFKLGDEIKVIRNQGSLRGLPVNIGDLGIIIDEGIELEPGLQAAIGIKLCTGNVYVVGGWEIELTNMEESIWNLN